MLTALVTTTLLRAGFHTGYSTTQLAKLYALAVHEDDSIDDQTFDPARLESALAIYVPSLGKCVGPEDAGWPEDPITGLLTADALLIDDLREINSSGDYWFVEWLREGGYGDVKADAPTIYDVVLKSLAPVKASATPEVVAVVPARLPLRTHCEFVGLWQTETSYDGETGTTDLDAISFVAEGRFVVDTDEAIRCKLTAAVATKPMWTLETAAKVIQALHPVAFATGWNLHLGGGVLMSGSSNNDLDILAVPRTQTDVHNRAAMHDYIAGLCPVWLYQKTTFMADRTVDAYTYEHDARIELIYLNQPAKS